MGAASCPLLCVRVRPVEPASPAAPGRPPGSLQGSLHLLSLWPWTVWRCSQQQGLGSSVGSLAEGLQRLSGAAASAGWSDLLSLLRNASLSAVWLPGTVQGGLRHMQLCWPTPRRQDVSAAQSFHGARAPTRQQEPQGGPTGSPHALSWGVLQVLSIGLGTPCAPRRHGQTGSGRTMLTAMATGEGGRRRHWLPYPRRQHTR